MTDTQLVEAAKYFQGNRPPVWSWTSVHGAALVKMSELLPTITERMQENIMFENVRKSHPQKIPPIVIELNKEINVKLITASYAKFTNLCLPGKFLSSYHILRYCILKILWKVMVIIIKKKIYIYFRKYQTILDSR